MLSKEFQETIIAALNNMQIFKESVERDFTDDEYLKSFQKDTAELGITLAPLTDINKTDSQVKINIRFEKTSNKGTQGPTPV